MLGSEIGKGGDPEDAVPTLCPHPGPKVQVIATLAAPGELRYSDVNIVSRGFKAKGPIFGSCQ